MKYIIAKEFTDWLISYQDIRSKLLVAGMAAIIGFFFAQGILYNIRGVNACHEAEQYKNDITLEACQ